jgi:hypothetical protein
MRKNLWAFMFLLTSHVLHAQIKPVVTVPLPLREVSGIVMDSIGDGAVSATVRLVSHKDTLQTTTNDQGIFIFRNVKSAEFIITVGGIGFLRKSQKYLNNDTKARLVLKPIVLKSESQLLNEVAIKGKVGPKYLKDTVEFWADDYIIRDYAKLEDLLKKMEGISVDKDGTVTHQGQEVKRAKFNGVNYFGGDIKNAIKELPANIVQRIQIIDDYGDQAAATGVKTGESTKVLNVVSKADKSVGSMYTLSAESNFKNRYYASGSLRRIDGHKQVSINASASRVPAGINDTAPVGTISSSRPNGYIGLFSGGSNIDGGYLNDFDGGLGFSNKLSDKLSLESYYTFKKSSGNTYKNSVSEEYYNDEQVNGSRSSTSDNQKENHLFKGTLYYNPGKSDQLTFNADLGYVENKGSSDNRFLQTGAIHILQTTVNASRTKTPGYRASALYTHSFKKRGSSISFQLNSSSRKEAEDREDHNSFKNVISEAGNTNDYELHNLRDISRLTSVNAAQAVFSQPISRFLKLGLVGAVNYTNYDNRQSVHSLNPNGEAQEVDSLSRIFNYQTIENPFTLKLSYNKNTWYELQLGIKVLGSHMRGAFKTLKNVIQRDAYNLLPELDLRLSSSKRTEFKLNYTALVQQPVFDQVLPIPDVTDPLNTRFGNPDLKSAFIHRANIAYNMYTVASKFNLSLRFSAALTNDKVISNQILINDPKLGIRRETHFINANGDYSVTAYYNGTKSFSDSRYAINFMGSLNYANSVSMNNGLRNIGKIYTIAQSLGLNATPLDWLEINPRLKLNLSRTRFTLSGFREINTSITEFNTFGKVYVTKLLVFGFDIGKNLVQGLSTNGTPNPFIVNVNLEKRMFKPKNGMLSLVLMDALKQNNLASRTLTTNGYIDSRSNLNSRYFLLQFSWNPQQWSGGKNAGKARQRDGMFIEK